jgi:DNA-directed RNA polymerase subunit E'/Rpb7
MAEESRESKQSAKSADDSLYKNILLEEYIYLKAIDLNNKIDDIILLKLKRKVEGRCIKVGYIIPGSVKIQVRSMGMINNANFDGITTYKVKYTADVCAPVIGQVIQCQVENIDKSQVICYIDTPEKSPLEIYLFKQHHVANTDFAALNKGDIISVKVGGSNWEYRDKKITTIAQFISKI